MSNITVRVVALVSALAGAACSSPSPVAPGESTPAGGPQSARGATALPGVYDLSFRAFLSGGFQEVLSLPVNRELILMAHVTEAPASRRRVGLLHSNTARTRDARTTTRVPTKLRKKRVTRDWRVGPV